MLAVRRPVSCAVAVAALVLLATGDAHAFKPLGHDVIEATAYKRLLAEPVVPGVGVSGKEVLASLIRRGVLARPSCFPDDSGAETECSPPASDLPGQWLPDVRSGREDLWLARQFSGTEQCFHFMAPTSDVYDSAGTTGGVPDRMVDLAPNRCVRFVNGMVDSILGKDHHADDAYVLLHAVVDSYSGAHAVRDETHGWKLEYLKPWRLLGAFDYCTHPSGWKYWSLTYHHDVVDAADDAWKVDSAACPTPAEDGVYSVPESCLTDRAKEAAAVAHDTLVALYVMTRTGAHTHRAAAWTAVLERLEGGASDAQAPVERESPYPSEAVWTPGLTAAAALGTYTTVRRTEALARLDWVLQGFPLFAPLVPSLRVDAGGARGADSGWVVRSPILGFTLPVTRGLSVEMPSLQLQVREGPKLDVVTNLVGIEMFPVDGYFVGVAAGQYSFASGVTDFAPSVMLGYAAGSETTAVHAHLRKGPRKQPPASRAMEVAAPATEDGWILPTTYRPASERVRYWYMYATEIGFSPAGGQAGLLGQEVVWRFAPWGAAGVHALAGGMEVSGTAYFSARAFPVVRLSPVPGGFVAFEVQPIGVVGATTTTRGFVAGMATPLSLVFDLGDLQIALDGPTGTWADLVHGVEGRGTGLNDGTVVGVRFGTDEHL